MTDPDPWVRYFSAIAMGQGCGAAELPSLVAMASGDPAPHVRVAAIEAIGLCAGADALRLLEPFLAEEGDIGLAAIRAIGRDGADTPIPALRDVLRSSDAARRAAAVDALVKCGGPDAVEPLQWTASTDDDQTVTTSALHGLGTIANRNDAGSNARRFEPCSSSSPTPTGAQPPSTCSAGWRPRPFPLSPSRLDPMTPARGGAWRRRSAGCRIRRPPRFCSAP